MSLEQEGGKYSTDILVTGTLGGFFRSEKQTEIEEKWTGTMENEFTPPTTSPLEHNSVAILVTGALQEFSSFADGEATRSEKQTEVEEKCMVDAATDQRIEVTPTSKISSPRHAGPTPPSLLPPSYNVIAAVGSLQHCSLLASIEEPGSTEQIKLLELQGKQLETCNKDLKAQQKNLETQQKNLETQQACVEAQQRTLLRIISPESETEQETVNQTQFVAAVQDGQTTDAHKLSNSEAKVETFDAEVDMFAKTIEDERLCSEGQKLKQKDISLPSVPYMDPVEIVMCDSTGGVFYSSTHDFGFAIPEGAILEGESINIEVGVTLTGPFDFPQGSKPVSPIVKLCVQQQPNYQFLKPVEVVLPHYLDLTGDEDKNEFQTVFLKAGHTLNGNQEYKFEQMDLSKAHFRHEYGILQTNHFCFLCIGGGVTCEITAKANFYLLGYKIMLDPTEWMVYFCVAYFLETCVEVCCV